MSKLNQPTTGALAASIALTLAGGDLAAQSLEEIVVTARRVEERLKDVPLSVTVFDANTIEQAGITSLGDIADLTPGLTFFNPQGTQLPVPVIRGVAPTDILGQQNAAIFIDGVIVSARRALNFSQLDIERIEILKGPQSAQYGRTALSGAINYITRKPPEEFEGRADIEFGNEGKQKGVLRVGGPLGTQMLRASVSLLYDEWDGTYENPEAPQNNIGGYRFRSYQGNFVFEPNDELTVRLGLYHSNDFSAEPAVATLLRNCEPRVPPASDSPPDSLRFQSFCGKFPKLEELGGDVGRNRIPKIAEATGEERKLSRAVLNIDWDLGVGVLSSLSGAARTRQQSRTDFNRSTGSNTPFVYCPQAAPGAPTACFTDERLRFFGGVLNLENGDKITELSQEIRFTSPRDHRFRYQVGGIYYTEARDLFPGAPIIIADLPEGDIGIGPFLFPNENAAFGNAIFANSLRPDGGLDPLRRVSATQDASGWGLFAASDFDLTDRLTSRLELRVTQEQRKQSSLVYLRCVAGQAAQCGSDLFDLRVLEPLPPDPDNPQLSSQFGSARFNAIAGRVGLDYRITEDWMVYGSIAKGDKPGGVQISSPNVQQPDGSLRRELIVKPFDPEVLWAYELGLKGRTPDGRLDLDMAVFFYDWQDIVIRQIVEESPVSGRPLEQPTAFNFNAASAYIWGWEMSAGFAVTDNLIARLTVAYVDASLNEAQQDAFTTFPSFAPDGDVSGNKLLRQPEWTSSFSLTYRQDLANNLRFEARGDVSYQDKIFVGNENQGFLPSNTRVNGRMGLHSQSGRYSVELWVRNLFNDRNPVAAFGDILWGNSADAFPPFSEPATSTFADFPPLRYTVTYPDLRTYGVTGRVRFGAAAR
ncbi:MAG: TonB-dependent receptor [Chromatiales bacterium]|nr:TonB-dependent receptor [Chromatiales bacterium]